MSWICWRKIEKGRFGERMLAYNTYIYIYLCIFMEIYTYDIYIYTHSYWFWRIFGFCLNNRWKGKPKAKRTKNQTEFLAEVKSCVFFGLLWVLLLFFGVVAFCRVISLFQNPNTSLSRFFPTCQVRVVRFYECQLPPPPPSASSSSSFRLLPPPASSSSSSSSAPQPRPSTPSVPCRTSTTTIHAQCSLPDLNHDHPRPVFPAGPQPRPSPPSVPCRTSTTTIHAQCSLPDLNREYPRQVFPAGPHVGRYVR